MGFLLLLEPHFNHTGHIKKMRFRKVEDTMLVFTCV